MFARHCLRHAMLIGLVSTFVAAGASRAQGQPLPMNMLSNPGFEYDWHNNNAEGHVLAFMGDWSCNGSDLVPDYWNLGGAWSHVQDQARSGRYSLLLKNGGNANFGAMKAAIPGPQGGGDRRWGNPPPVAMTYEPAVSLARTVRASVWYKSVNPAEPGELVLSVNSCNVNKSASATAGAAQWTRLDVELTRQEIEQAFTEGKAKGVSAFITFSVAVKGGAGIYVDDAGLAEDVDVDPNLVINGGFEDADAKTGMPADWTGPHKYNWYTQQYYKWTSWNHFFSGIRGKVAVTDLAARSGKNSLLMQLYPGDEMYVQGEAVVLNQEKPGIVEVGAYVLLDRVKTIDIRAVDEDGKEIPCADPFGGGWPVPQDKSQRYPSNADQWTYVRKAFLSTKPIKLIRPRLCARGFNGDTRDDGGTRPNVNQVGFVFWDDVRVSEVTASGELGKRGVKTPRPSDVKSDSLVIAGFQHGELFFGDNAATITLHNPTGKAIEGDLSLAVLDATGKPGAAQKVKVNVPAGQVAVATVPYRLEAEQMQGHWKTQGQMRLELTANKKTRTLDLAYNTWPVIADVDINLHYPTPEENPQAVSINLGVGEGTLKKTKSLIVEICRRSDNKVVDKVTFPDLAKAMADTNANFADLASKRFDNESPVKFADRKNLVGFLLDLGKLPVHPFDYPLRDHYLRIRGLDASGKEVFADNSQPIGRVAPNTEVLPAITSTKVRQDGAVLVNDKPVFIMAGNGYTCGTYALSIAANKKYGHNAIRWVENIGGVEGNWKENLYSLEFMVSKGRVNEQALTQMEADLKKWKEEGRLAGAVTISPYYEHSVVYGGKPMSAEQIALEKRYTQISNTVANRISNFGGGGAHSIYTIEAAFDAYDSFGLEIEPFGPPRGGLELAPILRKGGKAWFHLPQAYNNTPYEFFRFDHYTLILQGGRAFSTIHGLGDPSFMRGLTGEIRHLSPAIFSLDHGDSRTETLSDIWWMQRKVGDTTTIIAMNKPAVELGDWTWRDDDKAPHGKAHTGISGFMPRRTPDGLRVHGFREAKPIVIEAGDKIVQHVWLDPKQTPKALAWGVRGDAKWDFNAHYGQPFDFKKWRAEFINYWFAGELLPGTWQMGWQYNDVTRDWFADNILPERTFKSKGQLPDKGQWTRLEMSAEELGLVGKQIDGFFFIAQDGEAWWSHSAVVRGDKEIVLCGPQLGASEKDLAAVKFSVPWASDGTKVKVLFEERELVVKDGAFTDDFVGEDLYLTVRGGSVGDAIGWHPREAELKGQTLGYVTPSGKVQVRIYEIKAK